MVLNYADIIRKPYETVHRVENFLGLEHKILPEWIYFDKEKGFYCKYITPDMTESECLGSNKGRPHPEIPNETKAYFKEYYHDWNKKFFETIGEDFGWNDE